MELKSSNSFRFAKILNLGMSVPTALKVARYASQWWAVPPKKGPLSQGLKLPPKQVKKV